MHVSRLQSAALSYLRSCLLGQDPDGDPSGICGPSLNETRRPA
jgi:hypothetical protein